MPALWTIKRFVHEGWPVNVSAEAPFYNGDAHGHTDCPTETNGKTASLWEARKPP